MADQFLKALREFSDVAEDFAQHGGGVITAATGYGKTTIFPAILSDYYPDRKVAVLVPRRVAARAAARFVNSIVPGSAGYWHRHERHVPQDARVVYMTEGVFFNILGQDLSEFGAVIWDEAHERHTFGDVAAAVLHVLRRAGKDLHFGIMSATLNAERFAEHFGVPWFHAGPKDMILRGDDEEDILDNGRRRVPIVYRGGSTVVQALSEDVMPHFKRHGVQKGTILVFVSGKDQISTEMANIEKVISLGSMPAMEVLPLHSGMEPEEQDVIFKAPKGFRVVVSTNIAEASVTAANVVAVIDTGKEKTPVDKNGFLVLEEVNASKFSCDQRAGRAGRTEEDEHPIVVRLYSREDYDSRPTMQRPEIIRTLPSQALLIMTSLGDQLGVPVEEIVNNLLDRPDEEKLEHARSMLEVLGALKDGHLTPIGRLMAALPVDAPMARAAVESARFGSDVQDIIAAALAGLSVGGFHRLLRRPRRDAPEMAREIKEKHQRFFEIARQHKSDLFGLAEIIISASNTSHLGAFCREENALNFLSVSEAVKVYRQLRDTLRKMEYPKEGVPIPQDISSGDVFNAARYCIAVGFVPTNLWVHESGDTYASVTYQTAKMGKENPIFANYPRPELIVAAENRGIRTRRGSTLYILTGCTVVEPEWVLSIAPQHLVVEEEVVTVGDIRNPRLVARAYYVFARSRRFYTDRDIDPRDKEKVQRAEKALATIMSAPFGYLEGELARRISEANEAVRKMRLPGSLEDFWLSFIKHDGRTLDLLRLIKEGEEDFLVTLVRDYVDGYRS